MQVNKFFSVSQKIPAGKTIKVPKPEEAALVYCRVFVTHLKQESSIGRYTTGHPSRWFPIDAEQIIDDEISLPSAMLSSELDGKAWELQLGYVTQKALDEEKEFMPEESPTPLSSLIINERSFIIETADGGRVVVDRSVFDTLVRHYNHNARAKVTIRGSEDPKILYGDVPTQQSVIKPTLNFADKECLGCGKKD